MATQPEHEPDDTLFFLHLLLLQCPHVRAMLGLTGSRLIGTSVEYDAVFLLMVHSTSDKPSRERRSPFHGFTSRLIRTLFTPTLATSFRYRTLCSVESPVRYHTVAAETDD